MGNAQLPVDDGVILAIDQGSSSTRCVAFDRQLRAVASASSPVTTSRPGVGMVEHDAADLLAGVRSAITRVRDETSGRTVVALGIANQTETFVLWEADGGRAATPIVSWQDQRAGDVCRRLGRRPEAALVASRTGLGLDPTFSAPKLAWLFERDPGLLRRAESGELLFGDIACWLAWHLSGGGHVTEPSNACRTLLVDLDRLSWDDDLQRLFGVPAAMLPEIRPSDGSLLVTTGEAGCEAPIAAMLGDQPAALYGQGCTRPRMAALTLGTGAFLWLNVGEERPQPPPGVLATAAWQTVAGGTSYALEAFGANGGNALQILRELGLLPARGTVVEPDWSRPHPIVVPAPAGLGTPHWHGADRITVLDASSATDARDVAGAAVAGIAHQIVDALDAQDAAHSMDTVRVGGGLAADAGLLQAVADLSGFELEVSAELEATARGIAAMAAESIGLHEVGDHSPQVSRRVVPRLDSSGRGRERLRWAEAVAVHVADRTRAVSGGALSPAARGAALARMGVERFDVAVVGGGITGLGIALDAASRGLSVALVEANDLAYGTSSRSSKLIHGGLRYLEMLDFALVREALSERRLLRTHIAPHLVRPVPFLFPITHRMWERPYLGSGLLLYDAMGGARHLPRARHLSRRAALRAAPALRPDSLVGAVRFHDCQEDDALFAAYVARTAAAQGAAIATHTRATGFVRDESGRVDGLLLRSEGSGELVLRARHVICAAGVATDRVLELATGTPSRALRPSKGVHLLVPRARIAMRDGLFMRTEKSIFHAIPWGSDHWLLGDTDTEWAGAPDEVVASGADAEYVLSKVNRVLRDPIALSDVCGVFAGLRPLVAATAGGDTTRMSRKHRLFSPLQGMTAIAGGKYTTYRLMARDAVDAAAHDLGGSVPASRTHELPLVGAEGGAAVMLDPRSGVGRAQLELLLSRHGACADEVAAQAIADPVLAAPIAGADRYLRAEAVHAVTHQGALDLDDVLARRMRISIELPDRGRAAAADVAPLIAPLLGWSDGRTADEVARYVRLRDAEAAALEARSDADAVARYRAVLDGGAMPGR